MKVRLNDKVSFGSNGPNKYHIGEALYFRYNEHDELELVVLFYGFPGTFRLHPDEVDCLVKPE